MTQKELREAYGREWNKACALYGVLTELVEALDEDVPARLDAALEDARAHIEAGP